MKGYGISTYGDRVADVYDEWHAELDPSDAVAMLAALARSGRVLELAIGTGRIALPLAERGVEVHGIDVSDAMVAKLREKPGGDRIPVTMGDFADVAVDGAYSLVFVAFNTFFGLLTQEDQVRCFNNVAGRLNDDGVFVIEAFVPDVTRFDRAQRVSAIRVETERVQLDVSRFDPVTQIVESQHVFLTPSEVRLNPVSVRFAYPPELDLMAQLAGMRLRERWSSWSGEPFTADSGQHVSIYELASRS